MPPTWLKSARSSSALRAQRRAVYFNASLSAGTSSVWWNV